MSLSVIVEPVAEGGFCARSGDPLPFSAHGNSRDEALAKLRALVDEKIASGTEIVEFAPQYNHRFREQIGFLKDDPLFDEWQRAIEAYRDEVDRAEGIL